MKGRRRGRGGEGMEKSRGGNILSYQYVSEIKGN
jgi:hypothetical protein